MFYFLKGVSDLTKIEQENYYVEELEEIRELIHISNYEIAIKRLQNIIIQTKVEEDYLKYYITASKLLALCFRKCKKYKKAEDELKRSIILLKKVFMKNFSEQYYKEFGGLIVNLGIIYEELGNNQEALEEYKRAEGIFKKIGDNSNLFKLYITMHFTLIKANQLSTAKKFLDIAVDIAKQNNIVYDEQTLYQCYLEIKEKENAKS